jgi:glycosyltransferase involved in cell wall biosynthesis
VRVLFVALAVPFPPSNGQRLRNWMLLRALATEGHSVALLSFADPHDFDQDLGPLRDACESVQLVPLPSTGTEGWREPLARLRRLTSPLPYGTFRYRSTEMEAAVRGLLDRRKTEIVVCDDIYQFENLPKSVQACLLLNKHDLTFVVLRRLLARMRNPFKLAYGWLEYRKLRKWEALVTSQVAGVLVCSETDRRMLQAMVPGIRMIIAPNVIDVDSYIPTRCSEHKTVLYFGAMDYHANQDAVGFFVMRILPEVRRLVPDVKFVVAGRNPPDWLRRRFAGIPGVEFTGSVPDILVEIAKAAVCVVPLRIGSGTRLKILEAAAMAKPIVSTRVGAEGLDFVNGEEIILADQPTDFAQAVANLLTNPSCRRTLGAAARRRVELQYGLPALRVALRGALEKVVEKARDLDRQSFAQEARP